MEKEYSYKRLFLFFYQFLLKPYWPKFLLATILCALATALSLYNAYALAELVNFVTAYKAPASLNPLYWILGTWLVAMISRQLFGFSGRYIGINAAEKAAKETELFSINHLSQLDIEWQEKENSGNKLKKIDRGGQNVIDLTRLWLSAFLGVVVGAGGALIIISKSDALLAILLSCYLVIYFLIAQFIKKRSVKALKETNIKDEEITGYFYEIVANIRTIKVLGMANKIIDHTKVAIVDYILKVKKRVFWFQLGAVSTGLLDAVGRISLFSFVIWNIFQGNYPAGFLILFYGYFNTVTNAIDQLSGMLQDLANFNNNIGRLTDMLDEPITIDAEEGKKDFPAEWNSIEIKNLSFSYGDNKVLNKINLTIEKGQKVGIVGLSGAGKSTLFKLLLKEHEDFKGSILIGKTPIKNIRKSSYVNHTAAVLQETEVFNMSLKQNIVLANSKEEGNDELFTRAITTAHITDFLPKLPLGTETLIGEKGVKLSGGERQRLGIARAVFKSPEILFLDEATSHLDIESEQTIQDSLHKFFQNVTAVVIAHRLSTIKEMDKIVVIENGSISEGGSFDELYEQNGRFRELWDKQKV